MTNLVYWFMHRKNFRTPRSISTSSGRGFVLSMHTVRPTKLAKAQAVRMRLDQVFMVALLPRRTPLRAPALFLPIVFMRFCSRDDTGCGHVLVISIM